MDAKKVILAVAMMFAGWEVSRHLEKEPTSPNTYIPVKFLQLDPLEHKFLKFVVKYSKNYQTIEEFENRL
jgi:hypothetical protein